MLERWVFKGGTCLRLCHGGVRLCEDMDFSPVREGIDPFQYLNLERILQARLRRHYSINEVSVSTQRVASQSNRPIDRFLMRIVTQPSPSGSTVKNKVQRIKLDMDRRPISNPYTLQVRFPYFASYPVDTEIPIRAVTVDEILRDKAVALPWSLTHRSNPRYRDIWDIAYFSPSSKHEIANIVQQSRTLAAEETELSKFASMVASAVSMLPGVIGSEAMFKTMNRFLARDHLDAMFGDRRRPSRA